MDEGTFIPYDLIMSTKEQRSLRIEGPFLDPVDKAILRLLSRNARLPVADVAREVERSAPSVAERIRRLEDRGIIRGYTLDLDPAAAGLAIPVLIRLRPHPGELKALGAVVGEVAEISECVRITGDDCYVAIAHVRDVNHLEEVIDRLTPYAQTNTAIIQSAPVPRRVPPALLGQGRD